MLNEGDSVEARIVSVDRKSRQINLSVKAKEQDDTRQNLKKLRDQEPEAAGGPTTIGDLIKQQIGLVRSKWMIGLISKGFKALLWIVKLFSKWTKMN